MIFSGAGGYFVYWFDYRDNASISDIYVQRLDKDGNALWKSNDCFCKRELLFTI